MSARIGGVEYASCTTSGGSYSVTVPSDNPDTPAKDGGVDDDNVMFYVKGYRSNVWVLGGSATFTSGGVTELDLAITDNTPPAVTIDSATRSPENMLRWTLSGPFTEAFIAKVVVRRGGENIATAELPADGQWTATVTLVEGTNELVVEATDLSGNKGENTIVVFAGPPAVMLPAYSPDPTNDNTPPYSGSVRAMTKVVDIEFRVDNGNWTDVKPFTPAPSVDFTFTAPKLADRTHTIYVRAKDNAGNWSEIVSDTLTVDVTPPVVTLPAYTPDPTTDNTPAYSGTATDALTKVVDIKYRVDSGTWTDVNAFTPTLSVRFTFTTPALANGTHTIYVEAWDNAGNLSAIVSDRLTVNVTPPTTTTTTTTTAPHTTTTTTPTHTSTTTTTTTTPPPSEVWTWVAVGIGVVVVIAIVALLYKRRQPWWSRELVKMSARRPR